MRSKSANRKRQTILFATEREKESVFEVNPINPFSDCFKMYTVSTQITEIKYYRKELQNTEDSHGTIHLLPYY